MDALVGSSDQAYLSAASWSLVWAAAIRRHAVITGNTDCKWPRSSLRAGLNWCGQRVDKQ